MICGGCLGGYCQGKCHKDKVPVNLELILKQRRYLKLVPMTDQQVDDYGLTEEIIK